MRAMTSGTRAGSTGGKSWAWPTCDGAAGGFGDGLGLEGRTHPASSVVGYSSVSAPGFGSAGAAAVPGR